MRNLPSAFSYFLIFHEFNEAEKQELQQQQRLRKLAMELLSALKRRKIWSRRRRVKHFI
jgi:hypothetical protein